MPDHQTRVATAGLAEGYQFPTNSARKWREFYESNTAYDLRLAAWVRTWAGM